MINKPLVTRARQSAVPLLGVLALVATMLSPSSAFAALFGVTVVDDAGKPVSGASVCLGLPGNYGQFGMMFTDNEGRAVGEVPRIPFVVTVSKTRFSGVRLQEPARGFNLVKQVRLSDGNPGPRCKAGSTLADGGKSGIQVSGISAQRIDDQTRIRFDASGEPAEYRLSETEDFFSAGSWLQLEESIAVPADLAGQNEIFLQLRRYEGNDTSWIEARSRVVAVTMPLN